LTGTKQDEPFGPAVEFGGICQFQSAPLLLVVAMFRNRGIDLVIAAG
jgi:hypothetical protein